MGFLFFLLNFSSLGVHLSFSKFTEHSEMFSRSSLKLALGAITASSLVVAGPCDIYATGSTPCIAAHSTTRALYGAFTGQFFVMDT